MKRKLSRLQNQITAYGAKIITSRDTLIHASGHPGQEDLKQLIEDSKTNRSHPDTR